MKICVIGTRGFPDYIGGIETVCKHLYLEQSQLAPDLEIVVLTRYLNTLNNLSEPTELNDLNDLIKIPNDNLSNRLTVKTIPTINIPGIENVFTTFISILYALVFVRPQIIHLHGIGPGFFALIAKLTGIKVVVTNHAHDYLRPKWGRFGKWFLRTGEKNSVKYADNVICVSHSIRRDLESDYPKYKQKLITIRNGGTLLPTTNKNEGQLNYAPKSYFLYVGRIEATKAIEELIFAFSEINSDKTLLIVGKAIDGHDYLNYLKSIATSNIHFVGAKYGSALTALYENAFALVHPSKMEGYCLVVAEAISVKTPILLSDIAPHREFKLPEACFFNVGNKEQLKQKLNEADPSHFINNTAIDYQLSNTWKKNAEHHLAVYQQLLSN